MSNTTSKANSKKQLLLKDLFGDAYIDFLQLIYDKVLKVVNEVMINNLGKDRISLLEDEMIELGEEGEENDDFKNDIRFILVEKEFSKDSVFAKISDFEEDEIFIKITKGEDETVGTYKLNLEVQLLMPGCPCDITVYIWQSIAVVGLPTISKKIKREIATIFNDNIVEDLYIVKVDSVTIVRPFVVMISLKLINEEMVKPGGLLYTEAKSRFQKHTK